MDKIEDKIREIASFETQRAYLKLPCAYYRAKLARLGASHPKYASNLAKLQVHQDAFTQEEDRFKGHLADVQDTISKTIRIFFEKITSKDIKSYLDLLDG